MSITTKILPHIKGPRESTAIAGIGAECRTYGGRAEVPIGTCSRIARMIGCYGTEFVSFQGVSYSKLLVEDPLYYL